MEKEGFEGIQATPYKKEAKTWRLYRTEKETPAAGNYFE